MATDMKVIKAQLDAITGGQVAKYKLPEHRGDHILWVEINNTGKGKKYNVLLEKTDAGKPTGIKSLVMNSDNTKSIASYVKDQDGEAIK